MSTKGMMLKDIVDLMINSSGQHPYSGKLSHKENMSSATELARLFRKFASDGHTDEAMGIPVTQWDEVIAELETRMKR
jgi:hypothetical protein